MNGIDVVGLVALLSKQTHNPRMTVTRRVSVILPDDRWCSERENAFKWAIVDRIEALGLVAEIFHDPRGTASLCAPMAWSAANADFISRRCVGAVLIGLPRWRFETAQGPVSLPTEFSHFEGALAWQLKLPLLVLVQREVVRRVVFDNSFHGRIGEFPSDAGLEWLDTRDFKTPFHRVAARALRAA